MESKGWDRLEDLRLTAVFRVFPKREMQKGCSEQVWEKEATRSILNISYLHFHMYNFITRVGCHEVNVSAIC